MLFAKTSAAVAAAVLALPAHAFFRMPCGGNLVVQRADPIVSPGKVSGHVHQITGGNGFGFTETYDQARKSTCTTCMASQDLSNYWTPTLYYQDQAGHFTAVPQSGMTVYYLQRPESNLANLKAFPEGFRMLAGNPFKRNFTGDFAAQAVSFVCLDYSGSGAGGEWNYLPTHACPDGVRAQIFFPSCWDGKNLDSPDHVSHMAYPATGAYNSGTCPPTHPVQLVSIFFEVIFDTSKFAFWNGNYGTNQPFVLAQGDPTGYGFHGDFINGWDVSVLQQAIATCTNDSGAMEDCAPLKLQTGAAMAGCTIPPSINEDVTGPFAKLPGCNAVTAGTGLAPVGPSCGDTATLSTPQLKYTDKSAQGWAYQGCAPDSVNSRTLTGTNNVYNTDQDATTVETCMATCAGYQYMGLEYGKQCFCGNSIPANAAPSATTYGSCNMPCAGNSSQICGGSAQLSLYKACTGSGCTNAQYTAVGNLGGTSAAAVSSAAAGSGNASSAAVASSSTITTTTASSAKASSTTTFSAQASNITTSSAKASSTTTSSAQASRITTSAAKASSTTTTTSSAASVTSAIPKKVAAPAAVVNGAVASAAGITAGSSSSTTTTTTSSATACSATTTTRRSRRKHYNKHYNKHALHAAKARAFA